MNGSRLILEYLAAQVPATLKTQDAGSGRFLGSNGGWAVTNQDVVFPLALLQTTPGSRWHGSKQLLAVCVNAVRAWLDWQDADGRFEFIKEDGSRWGKTYMPWSIYHWLETWVMLQPRLAPEQRQAWERGLRLAYAGLASELGPHHIHNIPTWNAMSLVRAGKVFGEPDWIRAGTAHLRLTAQHQHPDGYWPEGGGATNGYNLVYMHAFGLYHHFTGARAALRPLRRGTEFLTANRYPDMSMVETIDGRQRYHAGCGNFVGTPGLVFFPAGRRLVRRQIEELVRQAQAKPAAAMPRTAAHLASLHQVLAANPAASGEETALPCEARKGRMVYRGKVLLGGDRGWYYTVNGVFTDPARRAEMLTNRWIMTRANNLSLWNARLGLLVGGGHSKHDPWLATFAVVDAAGGMRLEPDRVRFRRRGAVEEAVFTYGQVRCLVEIGVLDAGRVRLVFAVPESGRRGAAVTAHFSLCVKPGSRISWKSVGAQEPVREETIDPRREIGIAAGAVAGGRPVQITGEGWGVLLPAGARFGYPHYPFNPYAIDNVAGPEAALAVVEASFGQTGRFEFVVSRA